MAPDPMDSTQLTTCPDAELLDLQATLTGERRRIDARLATVAAEIARRSAPDAGMAGLAQRTGDRTPARLIERLTGVGADEARRLIAVGAHIGDATDPIGAAITSGSISVSAAAAITGELDRIVGDVPDELIRDAAQTLVETAATVGVAELRREARARRDDLDTLGVREREERLRERRRLAFTKLGDGMTRVDGLLDPESAALVTDAFDQALSPCRGGPRFTDPTAIARAQGIVDDSRTTEQLMADTFVQIIRISATADPGEVFGQTEPALRVHITANDIIQGTGYASIEGQEHPLSPVTAQRLACGGLISVLFDSLGQVLDLGRDQRLFTRAQRRAMAARDGGCLHPECDRPPSWTEAHHIDPYSEGGRTDIARGVLLCRFHHHWIHTHRHRITWRDGTFGMIHGTTGEYTPWPSKNPIARRRAVATR